MGFSNNILIRTTWDTTHDDKVGIMTTLHSQYTYLSLCTIKSIRRTLAGNKIVDLSDVVGASPVGAAPTTSSFST